MKSIKRIVSAALVLLMIALSIPLAVVKPVEAAAMKVYGIDVSKWQGTIDWAKVKAAGVKFVIIRIGTTYGKDGYFETNYTGAKAQGLDVGVYFYGYGTTESSIKSDANKVVGWLNGRTLEYPVYYDLEDNSLVSGYTNTDRTNFCIWFNTVIENNGYMAGVYTGYYWLNNYVNASTLRARYPIWMARYLNSGTDSQDYSNICGMWQYSSKGSCNGISGNLDMNVCYVDYPTYIKTNGLNHYSPTAPTTPQKGYYTVTATSLNIRAGETASSASLGYVYNGDVVAVIGFNTANTWAHIRHNGIEGWCSMTYLTYTKAFPEVSISYDSGEVSAEVPSPVETEPFASVTVSSSVPACGGYSFTHWKLRRTSDSKWQKTDGSWTDNGSASDLRTFSPSATFTIDEFALNSDAKSSETYVFTAEWEYIASIAMAYYTVTTNSSDLMVRSTDSTSGTVLARAPKGSELAVIGFNADASWARVIFNDTIGWSSMTYLTFKEAFGTMTVDYDMNGVPNVSYPSSTHSPFATVTVGGDGIEAEDYVFEYWTLTRESDGKTLCEDGSWASSPAEANKAHFAPGDTIMLNYANLNRSVSNDTYTFTADWSEAEFDGVLGDINGDGLATARDVLFMKKYIAGSISFGDIILKNGDLNKDGMITNIDVSKLKRLIVGNPID
ncbi:MAG: SH3 domain-containing protein [Clostridia bacterium]|nr:SH3 domain-containing protein [Clostridia bacterium]